MKRSRLYNLKKWRHRAARFAARGLNTRGRSYRQRQWRELADLHGPARGRERDRRRYRERHAPHLLPSRWEIAWRELRASMGESKTAEILFGQERHS